MVRFVTKFSTRESVVNGVDCSLHVRVSLEGRQEFC